MQHISGSNAICARFGGDEFIVASLYGNENEISADVFYQQMMNQISTVEGISEKPYTIDASIGATCRKIITPINVESMIAAADDIMYQVKFEKKEKAKK